MARPLPCPPFAAFSAAVYSDAGMTVRLGAAVRGGACSCGGPHA